MFSDEEKQIIVDALKYQLSVSKGQAEREKYLSILAKLQWLVILPPIVFLWNLGGGYFLFFC